MITSTCQEKWGLLFELQERGLPGGINKETICNYGCWEISHNLQPLFFLSISMANFGLSALVSLLAVSIAVQGHNLPLPVRRDLATITTTYPLKTIAGVSVVDTPIVRDAQAFARAHTYPSLYNHVMRTWLLGTLIIDANGTLRDHIDLEVHAVGALLHDIGLDPAHFNSPVVSPDRRFEVDGATAAREFVREHRDSMAWNNSRLQLLWDSIALHSTFNIADYKEPEVQSVSQGARLDFFQSAGFGVAFDQVKNITTAFPLGDIKSGFNESIVWLCQHKSGTTYGEYYSSEMLSKIQTWSTLTN